MNASVLKSTFAVAFTDYSKRKMELRTFESEVIKSKFCRDHRMTHTGEKKYVCPYCSHGFIQNGPFKRHIISIHEVEIPKGQHNSKLFIQAVLGQKNLGAAVD